MAGRTTGVSDGQGNSLAGPDETFRADSHSLSHPATRQAEPSETLTVLEETLSVSKRQVATGRVRVSTRTEMREEVADLSLERSVVDVVRVPIDRIVDETPQVRTEGETTIVPVFEERLVLVKQLVLVEELHIRRRVEHEETRTPVSLRHQHVDIEHLDADGHPVL